MSKSSESLIRIDAISVDLAHDMEKHHEARKCEHFSLREYAAEMRKKDTCISFPFRFPRNRNSLEEQIENLLPPLEVCKFKLWSCQSCLQETGATAEEIAMVTDCLRSSFVVALSHMQFPGDTALMLLDLRQAAELENHDKRKMDVNASTYPNKDKSSLLSRAHKKDNKLEVGHAAVIGHENVAGNDVNLENYNPTCNIAQSNLCLIKERHSGRQAAFGSKNSGSVECRGCYKSHATCDIKNLDYIGGSCAEMHKVETLTSVDGEQRIVSRATDTPKVVGSINEGINFIKGNMTTLPSLHLEEHDNLSSESNEILGDHSDLDRPMNDSIGLVRQKNQKVRLLTELLGSEGNAENDCIRREHASSSVMPNTSAGLDSSSALHGHIAVQGSVKKHFGGPKGKRKVLQDKDCKNMELIYPTKLTKKPRVLKGDVEITNMGIRIGGSESEEDPSAGVDLQAALKTQRNQCRIDRNPVTSKKKKQNRLESRCPPLMTQQEIVHKTNQVKIGDAPKHCTAATGGHGFTKSASNAFINSRTEPYFGGPLSLHQAERKSNSSKKKNKQVGARKAYITAQMNNAHGEGSIMRKDLSIMETEPEKEKFQPGHESTARKGLDVSLNSYRVEHRNEHSYLALTGDGVDPLLPQQKGTLREDRPKGKGVVMNGGESSVSHRAAADVLSRRGLLCDPNAEIATNRVSSLCEMQNIVPQFENGVFPCHQKLDFSGACNSENIPEVQEQGNDDIPMEIVELMARNQYERCCHEAERNYFFAQRTNDKRNSEVMGFPRAYGNRVLKSLQEEDHFSRKTLLGKGILTTCEIVGSRRRNPINCLSEAHGNDFNLRPPDGNSAFARFNMFSPCQDMQSGGVKKSDSGSNRNGNHQNCKSIGDKMASRFGSNKMPVFEVHNSFQSGSRQNVEPERVRSSLISQHISFGLNIPPKYANQLSNFEMRSQLPGALHERRMTRDLDLNFTNLEASNLEKQKRKSDLESFSRSSAEYPYVGKQREIDLNAKVPGSLDLHSNETIPAMQLLSLMDAGMQSSSAFNSDGNPKFLTKPFIPCDYHPKVSPEGTSNTLEKPLSSYEPQPKELSWPVAGLYNDGLRHLSPPFYGKSHPLKSCECSPAFGSFASQFQNEGCVKRGAGYADHVPAESQVRGRTTMKSKGHGSHKPRSKSGSHDSNPVQNKRKGFYGSSETMALQTNAIGNLTKSINIEASCANGPVFSQGTISNNEICSVNKNPADFTTPDAGNVYMISGEDLKFGKKASSKGRLGLTNVNGKK